jgi:predicted MFS family arabinose efflux permease
MLATGLTAIGRDFAVGPGTAASLVSVLYLCSAVMQPTIGKLGALLGPRRVFLTGLLVVLAGGIVGSVAPSFTWLLVSRALLGTGTSAAFPTAMALVRRRADAAGMGAPTRVIGSFSIASQVCVVLGLPLGGLLTSLLGWRALFAVNVPLAALAFLAVLRWVERDRPGARRTPRALLAALDVPGIILFATATIGLLVFLGDLRRSTWWLLAMTAALLTALLLWERRAPDPLIDMRVLAAEPALTRTYLRQLLTGLAVYTALYGISQWMGDAAGLSAAATGLIMIPLSGVSIVLARLVSVRAWIRAPLALGSLAVIAAGAVLLFVHTAMAGLVGVLIAASVLFGTANGLTNVAVQTNLYLQAPAAQIGTASGLLRTCGYIGAIFSSSLISITFGDHATDTGLHLQGGVVAALGIALVLLSVDRSIPWTAPRTGAVHSTGPDHT